MSTNQKLLDVIILLDGNHLPMVILEENKAEFLSSLKTAIEKNEWVSCGTDNLLN